MILVFHYISPKTTSGLYKHFLCTVQRQKNWIFNSVLKLNLQNSFLNFRKYRYDNIVWIIFFWFTLWINLLNIQFNLPLQMYFILASVMIIWFFYLPNRCNGVSIKNHPLLYSNMSSYNVITMFMYYLFHTSALSTFKCLK